MRTTRNEVVKYNLLDLSNEEVNVLIVAVLNYKSDPNNDYQSKAIAKEIIDNMTLTFRS